LPVAPTHLPGGYTDGDGTVDLRYTYTYDADGNLRGCSDADEKLRGGHPPQPKSTMFIVLVPS
jgi:YD repeat-containing protein